MAFEIEEIEKELERITKRLGNAPQMEATALYSAQQALAWVLNENAAASPYAMITDTVEASTDYFPVSHQAQLSDRLDC